MNQEKNQKKTKSKPVRRGGRFPEDYQKLKPTDDYSLLQKGSRLMGYRKWSEIIIEAAALHEVVQGALTLAEQKNYHPNTIGYLKSVKQTLLQNGNKWERLTIEDKNNKWVDNKTLTEWTELKRTIENFLMSVSHTTTSDVTTTEGTTPPNFMPTNPYGGSQWDTKHGPPPTQAQSQSHGGPPPITGRSQLIGSSPSRSNFISNSKGVDAPSTIQMLDPSHYRPSSTNISFGPLSLVDVPYAITKPYDPNQSESFGLNPILPDSNGLTTLTGNPFA